jgi:hypothetical protein
MSNDIARYLLSILLIILSKQMACVFRFCGSIVKLSIHKAETEEQVY